MGTCDTNEWISALDIRRIMIYAGKDAFWNKSELSHFQSGMCFPVYLYGSHVPGGFCVPGSKLYEESMDFYQTTLCYNTECRTLHSNRYENVKIQQILCSYSAYLAVINVYYVFCLKRTYVINSSTVFCSSPWLVS
jgi:hypothetical protein